MSFKMGLNPIFYHKDNNASGWHNCDRVRAGATVCAFDGVRVGAIVGAFDGVRVGATVGAFDRVRVGASVCAF